LQIYCLNLTAFFALIDAISLVANLRVAPPFLLRG
jgi:hypothetical protein